MCGFYYAVNIKSLAAKFSTGNSLEFQSLSLPLCYNYNNIAMTKAELISSVAKKTGIEKGTIAAVIEASMDSIKSTMAEGENIYLRGFGTFLIKERAEKVARKEV